MVSYLKKIIDWNGSVRGTHDTRLAPLKVSPLRQHPLDAPFFLFAILPAGWYAE